MRNLCKLLFLFLVPINLFAQKITVESSLDNAFELAAKQHKNVLVCIESPSSVVANVGGLADPEVIALINKNFVVFKTSLIESDARTLIRRYPSIDKYPAFVFLHPDKELFFYDFGSSSIKNKYLKMINDALMASTQKTLKDYESEYLANKNDIKKLTAFIDARKKQGITTNADLIEQYVNLLTIADFNKYETVLYILEAGPYLDGNAYKFSRTNYKLIDSIYKKEPLAKRVVINNAMMSNTMAMAIKTKNISKANSVASFASTSWGKDYTKGTKAYASEMLRFYKAIKDTAQYFRNAIHYYDSYYMTISADSIKKLEAQNRVEMTERMKSQMPTRPQTLSKEKIDSLVKIGKLTRSVESVAITTGVALSYANELNNAASSFYETGTKNLNHLSKALIWSKRAIDLKPVWAYYDTLAHVYYAMGIYNEALSTQKIALEMAAKSNQPNAVVKLQKDYEKMKDRTL